MFLLTATLIFISAVAYECHAERVLKCPFGSKNKTLPRVWCKRDEDNLSCCTGFSFKSGLDSRHLSVIEDSDTFTVSIRNLSQGDGVYWCGLDNGNNVIIKLAETEINKSLNSVWTVLRYVFFALLLLWVISTHICCSGRKTKTKSITPPHAS